jgi:glycosyltransferase involved in cell wall biosynthesis
MVRIPRVSIGLPIYNSGPFLAPGLQELLSQSFDDFEIVISDNQSIDSSWETCQEFAKQDNRIRLFRQPVNIGPWPNFLFTLDQAKAPYFMWAADDDRHDRQFIEKCVMALNNNPKAGLAFCHFTIFNHTTGARSPVICPEPTFSADPYRTLRTRVMNPISNMIYGLYRRGYIQSIGRYPTYFDWGDVYIINALSVASDVEIVSEPLFSAGIKTTVRSPVAANWRRIHVASYVKNTVVLAYRSLPLLKATKIAATTKKMARIMIREARRAESAFIEQCRAQARCC